MGIFSTNTHANIGNITIGVAEGYYGTVGAAMAALEGYQNDMAIFRGIIASDFQSAQLVTEGAGSDEVQAIQEASLKGAWTKLKEFFKKLAEKIKGIFHSFIAWLESKFMKNSKEFYKKYEKEIKLKDLKDFSVKVRTPKSSDGSNMYKFEDVTNAGWAFDTSLAADANSTEKVKVAAEKVKKLIDDFDTEDEFSKTVNTYVKAGSTSLGNITKSEFVKELTDAELNDLEDVDNWGTGSDICSGWVGKLLQDTKFVSDMQKTADKLESNIKKMISDIEKLEKEAEKVNDTKSTGITYRLAGSSKNAGTEYNDANRSNYGMKNRDMSKDENIELMKLFQSVYNLGHKQANVYQEVATTFSSTTIAIAKEKLANARKVFAAAVAYNPKKNEAALVDAVAESAFYDACLEFNEYEMA